MNAGNGRIADRVSWQSSTEQEEERLFPPRDHSGQREPQQRYHTQAGSPIADSHIRILHLVSLLVVDPIGSDACQQSTGTDTG